MGSRYLTNLADVIRQAGLVVHEESGWQNRARGSGGYDSGRPTHVMVHHTASPTSWDGQKDVDYCTYGDEDAPLCNLYLARTGEVWVCAGGATNTNGKGQDTWGGGVPTDSMNSYAIGIEANGGYGSSWPKVQCDAYVTLCAALCSAYAIGTNCIRGHFEWAPTRKVDPAGPSTWSTSSASWNMNAFRSDCGATAPPIPKPPTPTPEPATGDMDMAWRVAKLKLDDGGTGTFYIGDGKTAYSVGDNGQEMSTDEARLRMTSPPAINTVRITWDGANDTNAGPKTVTEWGQIKGTMKASAIKKFVGANKNL